MDRVALITGASRGMGAEVAGLLAKRGYDLVLTARGTTALDETAARLDKHGGRVVAIAGDVADAEHRGRLAEGAESLGRLDLLVNNASDLGESPLRPVAETSLDAIERVLSVNVVAPIGLIQATLPLLIRSGGLVANVSSDAALGGYPGWGPYGSGKAALDLLSLTLANELRDEGVAVVSVDPGDMRTQMHQDAYPGEDISDRPLPEVTLPFWSWLLGQPSESISGRRYRAQSDLWEVAA